MSDSNRCMEESNRLRRVKNVRWRNGVWIYLFLSNFFKCLTFGGSLHLAYSVSSPGVYLYNSYMRPSTRPSLWPGLLPTPTLLPPQTRIGGCFTVLMSTSLPVLFPLLTQLLKSWNALTSCSA